MQVGVSHVSYQSSSRLVDLYTQKEPYSGRGPNQSSDAFAPDEEVILYANVTYNMAAVPGKLVAYVISDPEGKLSYRTATTSATGVAEVNFTLPRVFGTWHVIATVEIAGKTANDTLAFKVDWIVEIVSLTTVNENLQPQKEFAKGSCLGVELVLRNIAMIDKKATLTFVAYDNLTVPINSLELNDFKVESGETRIPIYFELQIPKWAVVGVATMRANAYTAPPTLGGTPYCPEVSTRFLIKEMRDVSVISVTPSAPEVYVGEIVNISVVIENEGTKAENFNVTTYYNITAMETQTVTNLTPGAQRMLTFSWNTSGVPEGDYTISAVASSVPEETDEGDNTYIDGVVAVVVKPSPPVSVFTGEIFIIGLLAVAFIILAIVAILLRRKEEKEGSEEIVFPEGSSLISPS